MANGLSGTEVLLESLTFSDKDGEQVTIPLEGEADAANAEK